MNIIKIYKMFPNQKDCIKFLEQARWGNKIQCAYCRSHNTYPLVHEERHRHHCNTCSKTFSVTVNTIMHDTRLPLQKWFLAISLIGNAKKSLSSRQLARDLELPVKTGYSLSQRIRKAMLGNASPLLKGIIEIDETYIGGKPRYKNILNYRGRGTLKTMVVGALERGGDVIAHPVSGSFTTKDAKNFIISNADLAGSTLHTDEYKVYSKMSKLLPHKTVNHSKGQYVQNNIHTNTIEGFWSLLKRAYHGQHHHYSKKYTNLYVAEAAYKYNNRKENQDTVFYGIIQGLVCCA